MIKAPFSDEQVEKLNEFQNSGVFHPFTCNDEACRDNLTATNSGWICPSCGSTQDWAYDYMLTEVKFDARTED